MTGSPNIIGGTVFIVYPAGVDMVGKPQRFRVGDKPRDAVETEWEVFVRGEDDSPLRHTGSITAPSLEIAYEQATKLFAWYAVDIWLCPADGVARFSPHDLDDDAEPVRIETGGEDRSFE